MKTIKIYNESQVQILIQSVLHEISYTGELIAKCREIGCGVMNLQDRMDHLQILLRILTEKEDDGV